MGRGCESAAVCSDNVNGEEPTVELHNNDQFFLTDNARRDKDGNTPQVTPSRRPISMGSPDELELLRMKVKQLEFKLEEKDEEYEENLRQKDLEMEIIISEMRQKYEAMIGSMNGGDHRQAGAPVGHTGHLVMRSKNMASAGRFGSSVSPVKGDAATRDDSRGRGISKIAIRPKENKEPFQNRYDAGIKINQPIQVHVSGGNMYQFHYFDTMGRGECIRMLLKHAQVQFEDIRINQQDWPQMKELYPNGQLPMLTLSDGTNLG